MYPNISITDSFTLYTFWVSMLIAWSVFFYLLHSLSLKKWIVQHIFTDILSFILVPFFMGRFFHILAEWRDEKFMFMDLIDGKWLIDFLSRFFLTENYNLSFTWCVIGFFLVFFIKTRKNKVDRPLYYDVIAISFLISSTIGYIGAFLGWQIYGVPYDWIFSIVYDSKESIVPYSNPVFPLPILYLISISLIWLYLIRIYRKNSNLPHGFIGYMGFWLFGILLFLIEFLNGSSDMLDSSFIWMNFNQILGIYLIGFAFIWLGKSLKLDNL